MISYQIKQKIIDNTDIVEVISEYITLQKKGNSYKGICPFHADHDPSMSVSSEKKVFNCFSCGAKGTVINFVSRFENISEDAACVKLGKRIGIEVSQNLRPEDVKNERLYKVMREATDFYHFYLRNSEEGMVAVEYLHKRGINDTLIDKFKLGLAPTANNYLHLALNSKNISELDQIELGLVAVSERNSNEVYDLFRNRIMFPIADQYGRIVAFSGRLYTESNQAKYINSIETPIFHKSDVLYNLYNASNHIRKANRVYILEGFMDVFAVERAGIHNAVATMGTALTKEHLRQLLGLTKNITLCFDGDRAGVTATKRAASMFRTANVTPSAVILPDGLDPDEYLKKYGEEKLVTYLSTKAVDVYSVLYQNAYSKVNKTDVISVENFKKEIFEMIKESNSETIVAYFIKQISKDFNLDEESVLKDYQLVSRTNYIPKQENNYKPVVQKEQKVIKKRTSTKAITAYKIILRYCIAERGCFETVESCGYNMLPDSAFIDLYSVYVIIGDIYHSEELSSISVEKFLEAIKDDEKIHELGKEIVQKKEYYNGDASLFNEVLDTYEKYLAKLSISQAKRIAKESKDDKDIDDYQSLVSEKKTIKREE